MSCTVSRDDRTIKIMLFYQSAAQAMKKRYCYCFTMKIICTYLRITCNKKSLFVKNLLAYCGYTLTSPFFLLLSEYKHCDNVATNLNSENASLRGSVVMGKKEDASSTGCIWAAGFHHVMARSHLARIFKLMNRLFL